MAVTAPTPPTTPDPPPRERGREPSLISQMAAQMGRDAVFYMVVMGVIFPLGLINAIVLTHYLTTSEYGQLGVLFFVAGLATTVLNLLFLRGTEGQVWGTTDEGASVDLSELAATHERPRVLGTGLMMSIITAAALIAVSVPLAPDISQLLVHTPHQAAAVIWTAISGALGCVWRLVVNIGRWERRRKGFGVVWMLRPVLALGLALPLVAAGDGVAGAMAATAIGTFVSMALGFLIWFGSYRLALDWTHARRIVKRSGQFSLMVIGLFILHNGDVFLLSRFAPASQVGVYKLATNVTSIVSYAVSAFLMAWSPLDFTTLFRAAYERHGQRKVRGEFAHYYLIVGVLLVLVLTALATPIISLFSPGYHKAEAFVAITGAGYLAYGLVMTIARNSAFPHRYLVYGIAAFAAGAALIVTSLFLGKPLGGYGVATGDIIGGLVGVGVVVGASWIWGTPPAFSVRRMSLLAVITAASYVLGNPVANAVRLQAPLKVASILLFLVLVFATGVIPAGHRRLLWETLRGMVGRHNRSREIVARLGRLSSVDRYIVQALAREEQPLTNVAAKTGLPPEAVRLRLVAALRQLGEAGPGSVDDDLDIAEYLLAEGSITDQDTIVRALEAKQLDLEDLHRIDVAFTAVRRARRSALAAPAANGRSHGGLAIESPKDWELPATSLHLLDAVVRRGADSADVARRAGLDATDIQRRLVRALRVVSGEPHAANGSRNPGDALIGAYLFNGEGWPPVEQLWAAGIDPLELHRLERARAAVSEIPMREWPASAQAAEYAVTPAPAARPSATLRERLRSADVVPAATLALAMLFLVTTRLLPLTNSLWNDELHSAISYIIPGPSGIWGGYTPNDHMLFELLSWATVHLVGNQSEATMRIWGALPAIVAGALLSGWAWRRFSAWAGAACAVLFAISPLAMLLSIQARGYGLGLLASVVLVIAADGVLRGARRATWWLTAAAVLGIWTLPTFVLPFLIGGAVLALRRPARGPVLRAVLVAGVLSLAFYAPVLGALRSSASALGGGTVPWHEPFTGPLVDLLAPTVQLLLPGVSLAAAEAIGAAAVLAGVLALLLRRETLLALLLLLLAPVTYLAFQLSGTAIADRFMSFLLPPLLLLIAVGLAGAGRAVAARGRPLAVGMIILGLALSIFALRRGEAEFINVTRLPIEDWRGAAQLADREPVVITNSYYADSLQYYSDQRVHKVLAATALKHLICTHPQPFAYVEHDRAPSPIVSTDCLVRRGAVQVPLDQLRGSMTVWLVPQLARPARLHHHLHLRHGVRFSGFRR